MLTVAGTTEASRVPLCKPREHRKPVNRQLFFIADVSMKNGITAPMMPIAEDRCRHARTREGLKQTDVQRAPLRPSSPVRFRDLPLAKGVVELGGARAPNWRQVSMLSTSVLNQRSPQL
jgi:hypothetical protein